MQTTLATKSDGKKRNQSSSQSIGKSTPAAEQGFGASPGMPLFLQPKLTISQPGDPYEQEADRVAEQVMRMPVPTVQRQCAACTAGGTPCPACQEESVTISRKAGSSAGHEAPASVPSVLASAGSPLSESTRAFFEPRFGQDLSHVRVHNDAAAQRSAQEVSALAYTVGSHIAFDAGRYAPQSAEGQRLLAHELTHVVQQSPMVLRYRNSKSPHFRKADEGGLVEDSFNVNQDKETKPWIELIAVTFTDSVVTPDNKDFWIGEGTAKYYDNSVKLSDISLNLSGGPVGRGKTKSGTFTVKRIEGVGYMSSKYSNEYEPAATKGKGRRYAKDMDGNMNFAVFFYGGQALHSGSAESGSHGCVHVDWDDEPKMKLLNYHSVVGLTEVKVKYS